MRKADRETKTLYVRNNGASDLDFSKWADEFPHVEFYDYTKRPDFIRRRLSGDWPTNYALTYSYSERADFRLLVDYLESGGNVSVIFDTEYCPQAKRIGDLPDHLEFTSCNHRRFPIIDGDLHDLRHPRFDGRGTVTHKLAGCQNPSDA